MRHPLRLFYIVIALVVGGCTTPLPKNVTEPTYPFKTDGCSASPDFNFTQCCIEHDKAYWRGGSCGERKIADRALEECIAQSGHSFVSKIYHSSVRLFGSPYLPMPWRWGFGWPYGMGYEESAGCDKDSP